MTRSVREMLSAANSPSQQAYCPDEGDIIDIQFDPQAGREMAGKRPAIVLSPKQYNERTRLCVLCPITSKVKGYPFECQIPDGLARHGVVLADHVKSLDWSQRATVFACQASPELLKDVRAKIKILIKT